MNKNDAEQAQYIKMTETPVPKLILSLAAPTMVSMVVTAVYSMADTFFVARLGTSAAGAVGIVFSIMTIIQAVGFMIGAGAGSQLARLLGKRDMEGAAACASTALFMGLLFGLVLGAGGVACNRELMLLLGSTPDILPYAQAYAHYIFLGTPIMCGSFVVNNLLRAQGKAFLSTVGLATGALVNIALAPLFIFGLGLGISGAAIATLLSQCLGFGILLYLFLSPRSVVHPSAAAISRRPRVYLGILATGFPSFCRQSLASAATVALNISAAAYGDEAVAAMSIVGRMSMLFYSVILGFGQGFQPVAGYNYSAGKFARVKEGFRFCVAVGTVVMAALSVVGFVYSPEVLGWFRAQDAAVVAIGAFAFKSQCLVMPLQPFIVSTNMLFQSIGKSAQATFLSVCRQGFYFLPLIFLLAHTLGLTGIQLTQPFSDTLTFLSCFPILLPLLKEFDARQKQLALKK